MVKLLLFSLMEKVSIRIKDSVGPETDITGANGILYIISALPADTVDCGELYREFY